MEARINDFREINHVGTRRAKKCGSISSSLFYGGLSEGVIQQNLSSALNTFVLTERHFHWNIQANEWERKSGMLCLTSTICMRIFIHFLNWCEEKASRDFLDVVRTCFHLSESNALCRGSRSTRPIHGTRFPEKLSFRSLLISIDTPKRIVILRHHHACHIE